MAYTKKVWKDAPDTSTPINAANLNHMEDGIATADVNAQNALDRLDDVDDEITQINSDLTEKSGFYFGDATKHITNALDVNLNNTFDARNSCGYCTVNDTGVPSDFQSGVREVFRRSASHVMVRLTGIGTDNTLGIWVNYYLNNDWLGWKRFDLSTISTFVIPLTSTSFDATVAIPSNKKFVSVEIQSQSGGTDYTHCSTQYPLSALVSNPNHAVRTSYNNGTYYWCGISYKNASTIRVTCGQNMVNNFAIVRFYN